MHSAAMPRESATLHLSRRRQDVGDEPWLAIVIAEARAGGGNRAVLVLLPIAPDRPDAGGT